MTPGDNAARLIRWQRRTIAALLVAVALLTYTSFRQREQAEVIRKALQDVSQNDLLFRAEREIVDAQHQSSLRYHYQNTQSLERRLRKCEDVYGSTNLATKGCGLTGEAIDSGSFGPGAVKLRGVQSMKMNRH